MNISKKNNLIILFLFSSRIVGQSVADRYGDRIELLGIPFKDPLVLCQILIAIFISIAFLQSGIDKLVDRNGNLDFLKEHKEYINTPIILLTAKGEPNERIEGLEVGADDYLPKPFEPKELDLRIKNIINKTKKNNSKKIIEFENVKIDLSKQIIFHGNSEFKINNTEKTILEKMINNPGKVFEREEIGRLIDLDKERSIDVIITRLRKKIEIDPKNPKFLQTIRGAGYVLWIE